MFLGTLMFKSESALIDVSRDQKYLNAVSLHYTYEKFAASSAAIAATPIVLLKSRSNLYKYSFSVSPLVLCQILCCPILKILINSGRQS